jgi:hypothetical protein
MDKVDIKKLVKLRAYVLTYYNTLDGLHEAAAVTKQTDVANVLSSVIKSLDDLVKDHVSFV